MSSDLSQSQAYHAYDAIVLANRESLEDIIIALRQIHKKRLYLEEFDCFEDYVNARLKWSKSKAYRLLELTKCDDSVSHDGTPKQQKQGENEEAELQDTAGQHVASVKHSTAAAIEEEPIDTDETSRPQESTLFEPPTPKEASLEVNTLKEMIENYQDKITLFRWLWESSLPWQKAKYPEFIELWS